MKQPFFGPEQEKKWFTIKSECFIHRDISLLGHTSRFGQDCTESFHDLQMGAAQMIIIDSNHERNLNQNLNYNL